MNGTMFFLAHLYRVGILLPWLCCAVAAVEENPAANAHSSASSSPDPVRYRRVYVPKSELERFTQGYLPVKRQQFSELLEGLQRQQHAVVDPETWIQSAEYVAVFSKGRLTDGRAKLRVKQTGEAPSVLQLSPCQLALGAATWEGTDAASSAIVGNDLAGNSVALVRDSGLLQFSWTLRGQTNEWNETVFDVVLPSAPRNRLLVTLPVGFRLLSDCGIVSRDKETSRTEEKLPEDMERWTVRLGGNNRPRLTVVPRDGARQRKQLCDMRQETRYRLDDDGLEVDSEIEVDVHREHLDRLRFRVDSELQVTSVQLGNREVSWSLATAAGRKMRELQVRLEEPLQVGRHRFQLSAVGPLRTGDMWKLPRFHLDKAFWRQGTMTLELPRSLSLRHLETSEARQCRVAEETAREETSSPTSIRRFDLFSSAGCLEVHVVRTVHQATAVVGTTIDLEPGSMTARCGVQLSCDAGQHYVFDADVPNAWILDGIEAESSDTLQDHQFVGYESSHKRLRIRLARPVTADRPVRLTLRAHRTSTLVLGVDEFRPLRFSNLRSVLRLVAIAPDPGFRLNLNGDAGVRRLDPDTLPPTQAELLESRGGAVLFRDDAQADFLTVKVTRNEPTFTAENHVRAEFSDDSLTESYRLVCKPESTRVNRLLVLLSQPRSEPVSWSLEAGEDGNQLLSAKKVEEVGVELPQYGRGGEIWELTLRHPYDQAFEIYGSRTTDFDSSQQLSLASFPGATSQEGWLSIVSVDGTTISTEATAAKPTPNPVLDPAQCSATRARYRYDVSRNARVLIKHADPPIPQAPLWAWHCLVRSQVFSNGDVTHEATYLLESAGGEEFQFDLPPGCNLINVEIDGSHVTWSLQTKANGGYTVVLPGERRFPRVTVVYASPKRTFQFLGRVAVRVPRVDIPVLDRQWRLWLAPGLRSLASPTGETGSPVREVTWSERLLGPFSARPHEKPWRPFNADQWTGWGDAHGSPNSHCRSFLQLLGARYLALAAQQSSAKVTWRELWERYRQEAKPLDSMPRVWIDARNLSPDGYSVDSVINEPDSISPIHVASELLHGNNMAAVSHHDKVMITSLDRLALAGASVQATSISGVVNAVSDTYLSNEMKTLETWPRREVVPLDAWIAKPSVAQSPWKSEDQVSRRGVAGHYWRAHEIIPGLNGGQGVLIVRVEALKALGRAILLITAGLASWLCTRGPARLLAAMAVAAIVAFVVPAAWVPLASHLFLGLLVAGVALVVRYLARGGRAEPETTKSTTPSADVAVTPLLCALAVFLTWPTHCLFAASPSEESAGQRKPSSEAYQVRVPVDEDGKPSGDYVYLPTEFYDIVHGRREQGAASPRKWLVRRGTYRAMFNWARQRSSLELTSFTATYQLELFQPQQQIEFPWNGTDSAVQILEARLGGQPIELTWNSDRTAFFITVPGEGLTRLELVLWPGTTEKSGVRNLRFQIPPMSRSQLHLETPVDAPPVRVNSALGAKGEVVEPGERLVDLGPARVLELQWASRADSQPSARQLDVEQLSWIKVRPRDHPESVIVDSRFTVRPESGQVDQIRLAVAPELKLLPLSDDRNFDVIPLAENGGPRPFRSNPPRRSGPRVVPGENSSSEPRPAGVQPTPMMIRLRESTDQVFTIHLQFRIANSTGLGNVSLPRITASDGRIERDWLAVSVASDLQVSSNPADSLIPMDAAEFLTGWGEAEVAPDRCYRVQNSPNSPPDWRFSTRAREPHCEARQQLDISVGHASIKLVFNADIEMAHGTVFQYRFAVPQDFRVREVSVTASGDPVGTQAKHDGSGEFTLFLDKGISEGHHVELRGELKPPELETEVGVPGIGFRDVTVNQGAVRVYRKADVLVSVKNEDGGDVSGDSESGEFRKGFGRLLTTFSVDENRHDRSGQRVMRVSRNRPSWQARIVTTLRRSNDNWIAISNFQADVVDTSKGEVGQFRFEIPKEWTEPFSLQPAMPYEVKPLPGQRRHLIIRPRKAVSDQFEVSIRGPLALGDNERGRTPNIVPLDAGQVDRFFVLPTQLDQQRIYWETSGLRVVSLQEVLPERELDRQGHVAYAVYSRPRAVISDVRRVAGERKIALADVHVTCRSNGCCFGMATFQVEPAGKGWVTLECPEACELIQTTVEGVATILTPVAQNRWKLRLASEQLPQQLGVLFRTRLPSGPKTGERPLKVPWIADIDVSRTLWTLHGPQSLVPAAETAEEHRVSSAAQVATRLAETASHVESAVETVLDSAATEINAWYTPWAIRLAECAAQLARGSRQSDQTLPLAPEEIESLYRQQQVIGQRLNVSATVADFRQKTARFPQPAGMVRFMQPEGTVSRHYAFEGEQPSLSLAKGQSDSRMPWAQILGGATVALLGLLGWRMRHHQPLLAAGYQWPYAIAAVAGLAWWLFASPSFLGWLVVVLSVWGALRFPVRSWKVRGPVAAPTAETSRDSE